MPLFKRKPIAILEPPRDLEPHELVYQVRFTKEIFQDYQEYLKRINFYRKRVWMCKSTGKTNLTYEEALVSEKRATEKVQELPKELVAPALHIIQFSMLSLKDLANTIASKLQEHLFAGAELYGRKDGELHLCKILKVLEEGAKKARYEVGWLDRDKKISENAVLHGEDLIWKKFPFSRNVLKSFIRESTSRSIPWVLHEKLARKHGVSADPPEELRSKFVFRDGQLVCKKKRKKNENVKKNIVEVKDEYGKCKRKKIENGQLKEGTVLQDTETEANQLKKEPVKYPIDDLLVQPGPDDPVFTERPSPSRDFNLPMDCIGDLLMVWDFCSSFGRLLNLFPFSLEDFENAICHKDGTSVLNVELHASLFRSLIKHNGQLFSAVQKRSGKSKITLITWTEYLSDFLEMINIPELCSNIPIIKRGHYSLLEPNVKLGILRELVNQALATDLFREKLDEHIEQRQVLGATRRGEALEEARKKREEKQRLKTEADANGVINGFGLEETGSNMHTSGTDDHHKQNGYITEKRNGEVNSSQLNGALEKSEKDNGLKKTYKKQNINVKIQEENGRDLSGKEAVEKLRDDKKEAPEKSSKDQRREYYEREIEKRIIRTNSLGKDRDYNRYWWFRRDGRIFIESSDSKQWGYYNSKEELDALMGSLNRKGERERALQKQLEKFYDKICSELHKRSKDLAQKLAQEEAVLRRSTRVRAPPRENPAHAFLRYVNKWKED